MTGEELYTLEQAKLEIARQECGVYGHAFSVIQPMAHKVPVSVICTRCHESWRLGVPVTEVIAKLRQDAGLDGTHGSSPALAQAADHLESVYGVKP